MRSKQLSAARLGDPEEEDSDENPSPEDEEEEKVNDDDDGEKIFPMDDPDRNASSS